MSYFEEEVEGKLSPSGKSPTSSFRTKSFTHKIHTIRSVLVEEEEDTSQHLIDQSTNQESGVKAKALEDSDDNDSMTRLNFNTIEINKPSYIKGTKSRISSDYQMSDSNLRLIKRSSSKKTKIMVEFLKSTKRNYVTSRRNC